MITILKSILFLNSVVHDLHFLQKQGTSAEKVMKIYSSKKYAKNSFNCEQNLGNSMKEENLGIL